MSLGLAAFQCYVLDRRSGDFHISCGSRPSVRAGRPRGPAFAPRGIFTGPRSPGGAAAIGFLAGLGFPQPPAIPASLTWRRRDWSYRLVIGGNNMTNWQADLAALVEETMAFAKSIGVERPMPRAVMEPNRIPPVNLNLSERDQIRQRVANFK